MVEKFLTRAREISSEFKDNLLKPISYARQLKEKQGSWIPLITISGTALLGIGLTAATLIEPELVDITLPALVTTLLGYSVYLRIRPKNHRF